MGEELNGVLKQALGNWSQGIELMEKLFATTQPGAVFSEPVVSGDHTVITASEVMIGLGFGYGAGGGSGEENDAATGPLEAESAEEQVQEEGESFGVGGGGGGGGGAFGRPVAAISIGPEGVRVAPVVDVTKIGLALFTTLGAMLLMLSRMRRASQP